MCGLALFVVGLAGLVLMLIAWSRMAARRQRARDEMRRDRL